jgi:hypothetical protein
MSEPDKPKKKGMGDAQAITIIQWLCIAALLAIGYFSKSSAPFPNRAMAYGFKAAFVNSAWGLYRCIFPHKDDKSGTFIHALWFFLSTCLFGLFVYTLWFGTPFS